MFTETNLMVGAKEWVVFRCLADVYLRKNSGSGFLDKLDKLKLEARW